MFERWRRKKEPEPEPEAEPDQSFLPPEYRTDSAGQELAKENELRSKAVINELLPPDVRDTDPAVQEKTIELKNEKNLRELRRYQQEKEAQQRKEDQNKAA